MIAVYVVDILLARKTKEDEQQSLSEPSITMTSDQHAYAKMVGKRFNVAKASS